MAVTQQPALGLGVIAQSFSFFGRHKGLAIFPVVSFIIALCAISAIAFGVFEVADQRGVFGAGSDAAALDAVAKSAEAYKEATELLSVAGFAALFGLHLVLAMVFTFFQVALAACVLGILRDESIGFMGGLSVVTKRLPTVVG